MYKQQKESFWSVYKKHWKKHKILMTIVTIFCRGFILFAWIAFRMLKMVEEFW